MDGRKFGIHIARLIEQLRGMGISLLDEMENTGQVSPEDRRTLQYEFCSGLSSAHFAMDQPKEAVASHNSISKDRQISSTIDHGIRMAVEDWLEHVLSPEWRLANISSVQFLPSIVLFREHLTKLRDAVRAKPSEVRARLNQRITIKCAHCHQPGHAARLCPFKFHGVTTGREPCSDERTAGA